MNKTKKSVLNRISSELSIIEKEKNVNVLYACESGSRAWGFPSKDSDYDVRFIYIHPLEWYLSISEARDVIEKPITDDLDISGWDLRKALRLFRKSNPPLMEWFGSPIIYREDCIVSKLRELIPTYYSQTASSYHYLHMAKANHRAYLQGNEIWTKKYFYVLRPIMAIIWMEQGLGVVPTNFNFMLDRISVPLDLKLEVERLIEMKKNGDELRIGARNDIISSFIEMELDRLTSMNHNYGKPKTSSNLLDKVFLDILYATS